MQFKSLKTYNYDESIHPQIKNGMSQPDSYTIPDELSYKSYALQKIPKNPRSKKTEEMYTKTIEFFVRSTKSVAKLIQLDHPGFLPNQRQHRQFGLSVLQIAQSLREHVHLLHMNKVHFILLPYYYYHFITKIHFYFNLFLTNI